MFIELWGGVGLVGLLRLNKDIKAGTAGTICKSSHHTISKYRRTTPSLNLGSTLSLIKVIPLQVQTHETME